MSKKDEMAARAAQLATRAARPAADEPPPARRPAPRARPVKLSTEISPNRHRFLAGFVLEAAQQAGRARVAHSEVVRALLDELEADPALQARVTAKLVEQLRD